MRFHIGWRGERSILYKGVETLLSGRVLRTLGEAREESPKRTISVSGRLGLFCIKARHRAMCQ